MLNTTMERKIIYISFVENDYRLNFLSVFVIVDYKYSSTDSNMYKSYILCQSIPFIAKKIGSRNVLDETILFHVCDPKINAQYL